MLKSVLEQFHDEFFFEILLARLKNLLARGVMDQYKNF